MKYINRIPELRQAIEIAKTSSHPNPTWPKPKTRTPKNIDKTTQEAIDTYLQNKQPDGTIDGTSWWQTANGYTAIALHDLWSGSPQNYDNLSTLLHQCEKSNHPRPSFINDWNDDSCWWALCCVHMYSIGQDPWFLERAKEVWRYVSSSVCGKREEFFDGMDMEGAVFWKSAPPGEDHINAISTGLYAELSVRLALIEQKQHSRASGDDSASNPSVEEYLDAALKSLRWILRCRYMPEEALVLDHIELKEQKAVNWIFTYNTGVVLGICALLYEATWEDEWIVLACYMVSRIWSRRIWIEEDGVLTESGAYGRGKNDPLKNSDAVGFKSVLVRQLCTLRDVVFRTGCSLFVAFKTAVEIGEFVKINFDSQMERNTDGQGHYGPWWNGPFESPTSHSQMAVLDVMAAITLVNKDWMHSTIPG